MNGYCDVCEEKIKGKGCKGFIYPVFGTGLVQTRPTYRVLIVL